MSTEETAGRDAGRAAWKAGRSSRAWRVMTDLVTSQMRKELISERLGISFGRARVLRMLANGNSTLGELASQTNSDPPYVTLMVDDLEEAGLVKREPHPDDRRAKFVVLTPKGRKLAEQANAILYEPPEPLKQLSDDDLATLIKILERCV